MSGPLVVPLLAPPAQRNIGGRSTRIELRPATPPQRSDSPANCKELYAKAPGPKELFLIKGAAHKHLYDGKGAVAAVNKMVPSFKSNLATAKATRDAQTVAAE